MSRTLSKKLNMVMLGIEKSVVEKLIILVWTKPIICTPDNPLLQSAQLFSQKSFRSLSIICLKLLLLVKEFSNKIDIFPNFWKASYYESNDSRFLSSSLVKIFRKKFYSFLITKS